MRKAALRWGIYRIPVRYVPIEVEAKKLAWLPRWQYLTQEEKGEALDNFFAVYNAEEIRWGRTPLKSVAREDTRSRNKHSNRQEDE